MNETTEDVQSTEETGAEQQQEEKTFTQDEVNAMIEKRLARERKKVSNIISGKDPKELELDEREKTVTKREMQVTARTLLTENGIPDEALEILNYESEEKLQESIKLLRGIINTSTERQIFDRLKGGKPLKKAPQGDPAVETLRDAFGLRR